MQASWVGQREDDGPIDVLGHFLHDVFREGFGTCTRADEDVRFDLLDDVKKGLVVNASPLVVGFGVWVLCWSQVLFLALEQ